MSISVANITRVSFLDALFYSLMVGLGETYFVAFALALGVRPSLAGMIGVVPVVIGSMFQIFALKIAQKKNLSRGWVVSWAWVQSFAMLMMCSLAIWDANTKLAAFAVFFFATLYWSAAQCAGPVWNVWIGAIIPSRFHLRFFVHRTRLTQLFTLLGLIAGGLALRHFDSLHNPMTGFALLFALGAMFRIVSARYLAAMPPIAEEQRSSVWNVPRERVRNWLKRQDVYPILLFLFITNIGTHFSAPFFSPFMLGPLALDYTQYTVLISAAFLARVGSSPLFYAIANRYKVRALVVIGALTVIPLPYLWTLSDNFAYLIFIQLLSGFAWGSHELGVTLYLIERIPHGERARLLGWANAINSVGMLIGSSFGAFLIASSAAHRDAFISVFVISSFLRILPIGFLFLWVREPVKYRSLATRVMGVRPGGHDVTKPVLHDVEETHHEEVAEAAEERPKTVNE